MESYYGMHMAMAALVGASFVAVSAYYMHKKTLTQLLDLAKTIEQQRQRRERHTEEEVVEVEKDYINNYIQNRRRNNGERRQHSISNSFPDVRSIANFEHKEDMNLPIPVGLPPLRKFPEGQSFSRASSFKRGHIVRPISPRSPVASASAFGSVEGSDDEDEFTIDDNIETSGLHGNENDGTVYKSIYPHMSDHIDTNVDQNSADAARMSKSHSVSGNIHGVQPCPVKADILRKEPEHETCVQLRINPTGQSFSRASSFKRGHIVRPISPRSPVASASAFGSVEGSDDEDEFTIDDNIETSGLHGNENDGTVYKSIYPHMSDHIDTNVDQNSADAARMSKSHSVSGNIHGVQPCPVKADILRKEPEHETCVQLRINPTEVPSPDQVEAYQMLQECLELRQNYVFMEEVAPWEKEVITDPSTPKPNLNPFSYSHDGKTDHHFQVEDGVVHVYANKNSTEKLFPVADATTFFTDLHRILRVTAAGNIRTLCHHRLVLLEQKFNLHLMLNADKEFLAQKSAPHRDFYNVRKVDTHIHHSACMNQKHLLRFIKSKLRKEPDEVVIFRDGTYLTLKEVFESLDLTGYDLNVDLLDVHADKSTFHRFDKFNLKYNPCGQSRLREIFLKQDNLIQGRFLGEVTKQVFSDLEASKYQMAEYRISIYGRKQSEWDQLASWIINNDLYSENVVWLIQLPRLYNVYKEMGIVTSFQNMLDNIFLPLFEVTVDPDSHPQLHVILKQVVGLDLVDDESKPERRPTKHMPTPAQWTNVFNPAFSYYAYYCYANLYTLNKLRESKGMTTIKFRPHAGE
ncbi:Amp deaminase, partial [Thalictrum thalictroides]